MTRSPEEILVTSGAQQGLDLVFRTFTDARDPVAMESPSYPGALALARFAGVEIIPMPMTPDGPDVTGLRGRRVKVVYVMPERQNPTGVTSSDLADRLPNGTYVGSFENAREALENLVGPDDLLLLMGAGDIRKKLGDELAQKI